MDGLFASTLFASFGPSRYAVSELPPLMSIVGPRPRELREALRETGPRCPGVYGMVDAAGELIYVGKAKSLRARLLSYFRTRSRDPKAGRIIRKARAIVWEPAPSEFGALLRELELIQRWRPRFNVQGQPRQRRATYVCLGRQPAPYLFVTRRPPAGALACYGPVSDGRRTASAVRWLNDAFGLRDCPQAQPMIFAEQAELFPVVRAAGCLRHEIGTCLGPCAAACTRTAYTERTQAVRAFLEGADTLLLDTLERDMTAAATALAYERAATLRDKHNALLGLHTELERLRSARNEMSFLYPVPGDAGLTVWYLVRRGLVVRAVAAPHDRASRRATAGLLTETFDRPTVRAGLPSTTELDTVLLLAAWFRRFPAEKERTLTPEEALALCGTRGLAARTPSRRPAPVVRR